MTRESSAIMVLMEKRISKRKRERERGRDIHFSSTVPNCADDSLSRTRTNK